MSFIYLMLGLLPV